MYPKLFINCTIFAKFVSHFSSRNNLFSTSSKIISKFHAHIWWKHINLMIEWRNYEQHDSISKLDMWINWYILFCSSWILSGFIPSWKRLKVGMGWRWANSWMVHFWYGSTNCCRRSMESWEQNCWCQLLLSRMSIHNQLLQHDSGQCFKNKEYNRLSIAISLLY